MEPAVLSVCFPCVLWKANKCLLTLHTIEIISKAVFSVEQCKKYKLPLICSFYACLVFCCLFLFWYRKIWLSHWKNPISKFDRLYLMFWGFYYFIFLVHVLTLWVMDITIIIGFLSINLTINLIDWILVSFD